MRHSFSTRTPLQSQRTISSQSMGRAARPLLLGTRAALDERRAVIFGVLVTIAMTWGLWLLHYWWTSRVPRIDGRAVLIIGIFSVLAGIDMLLRMLGWDKRRHTNSDRSSGTDSGFYVNIDTSDGSGGDGGGGDGGGGD
jgi:uncharacterized membrane protein YgcG